MAWFKADDQLPFHPKVLAAGNAAMGLWIRAGTWSSSQLTDGFIPNAIASAMANECDADALVDAKLWDRAEGGYQFHDWSDFQPSADVERKKREDRKRAGRAGAAARWGDKSDGKSHGNPHGTPDGKADGKTMPRSRSRSHVSPTETRPDVEQICGMFADLCEATATNGKRPTITQAWRDAARRLIDLDGRSVDDIERIAHWALTDDFWVSNVRSLPKLREKFETLTQQAQRPTRQQQARPNRDAASARGLVQAHEDLFGRTT